MGTKTFAVIAVLIAFARTGAAQPPRPADSLRTVTLAVSEYNRLIDLARQPAQGPSLPPVPAVLSSADLRVRVDRETARGVFNLAGDVLRDGFSRVTLLSGATLVGASAAGQPLPLVAEGGGHVAVLPGPGPFSLALEWGAPLVFSPGRASFTLPVPPSGTARATFDLPGEQADVRLSAGLITRRSTAGGRTIVEATLDPGGPTQVSWSMRDSAPVAAAREARTLADVYTLVTLDDSDVRMVTLVDLTVVQGEPRTTALRLPAGYEVTSVSGSTVESSDTRDGTLTLTLSDPSARRHQILVSLERPHAGGSFSLDTAVPALVDAGRERGEIAIEGVGTLELAAEEREGMHRIDVKELNAALQSLSALPILSAFRYQRGAGAAPAVKLDVKRFADAGVLAAVAERAYATTLVTSEGRALTEITLWIQNRAQPFLKVMLPEGATIASVEIDGQPAKPVSGPDGTRVPLLRPGFRPKGQYTVSFVYLHAGTRFARKGDLQMTLPQMDIPVGIVEWETFVPGNYSVRATGGNVIDARTALAASLEKNAEEAAQVATYRVSGSAGVAGGAGVGGGVLNSAIGAEAHQIRGRVVDPGGSVLPGVTVALASGGARRSAVTRADGSFVFSGVPSGPVTLTAELMGFFPQSMSFVATDAAQQVTFVLPLAGVSEALTVSGQSPKVDDSKTPVEPPQNIINLQRRAAGVLPVRIDVPRAGTSHRFIRPLVVDQETTVTMRYKRR